MKYKVGDEVLIRCKIVRDFKDGYIVTNSTHFPNINDICFGSDAKRNIFAHSKEVYPALIAEEIIAEEALKIAKKFNSLSSNALIEIFDTDDIPYILDNLTFWKIKEKIEGWESNQIKVGDFVEFEGTVFCVTGFIGNYFCGIDKNGLTYSVNKEDVKKNGRHIDINKILKEIGDD